MLENGKIIEAVRYAWIRLNSEDCDVGQIQKIIRPKNSLADFYDLNHDDCGKIEFIYVSLREK